MGLLKVGMVSVDGTHMKANASKHKSVRYDRAEKADAEPVEDGQKLPQEIARREALLEKMRWARQELEKRAKGEQGKQEDQTKPRGPTSGGESPAEKPKETQQINLTNPDSALMRKSRRDSYEQAYNAQTVVDTDGSQLILATDVIATPSDANELEAALDKVVESVGTVQGMLADGGYVNVDYRPSKKRPAKKVVDPRLIAMREKVTSEEGKRTYGKRASSVEPVFGIIKSAMGLRQFLLRGIAKVCIEWDLACLAYNMRRLWSLTNA